MQFTILYSCNLFNYKDSTDSVGIWYESINAGQECDTESYSGEDRLVSAARSSMILSMMFGLGGGVIVLIEWIFCEICCAGCVQVRTKFDVS